MRVCFAVIIGGFLSQQGLAMDVPHALDDLLAKVKALPNVKGVPGVMQAVSSQDLKVLCEHIKASDFYGKAESSGITTLKRNAMISFCQSGTVFERADLKQAIQKEKQAAPKREQVQLRHVDFGVKGKSVEEEQANLKAAQAIILENAKKLGKQKEIGARLAKANEALAQAQESYDNLAVAIIGMREDLKGIHVFQFFKPSNHEHDTPEQYMEALTSALPRESRDVLHVDSRAQLQAASDLLRQANDHLAIARHDLEAINREMLEMVKR